MATAIEDLFKNIGSQVQLSSPLGKLLERLARGVGVIASLPASIVLSALLPDYGWVKRGGSTLVGLTNGSFLEFNSVGPIRGISFENNRYTLNPGKTYRITLIGTFEAFSDPNDLLEVKFTDDTGAPLQDATADSPTGQWRPVTSASASSSGHGLEMIYQTPPTFSGLCIVRAHIVNLTGTVNMPQNALTWTVEEIPGGV